MLVIYFTSTLDAYEDIFRLCNIDLPLAYEKDGRTAHALSSYIGLGIVSHRYLTLLILILWRRRCN